MTNGHRAEYEFYYWPHLPGRGELIRLVFEAAGADYVDVCRLPAEQGGGVERLLEILQHETDPASADGQLRPFAPPIVRHEGALYSQTANLLDYTGRRLGLAGDSEFEARCALQLQLCISDTLSEIHDVHHPISASLYYEDQKGQAVAKAGHFLKTRLWKWLTYYRGVLTANGGEFLIGRRLTYVDLSLFQLLTGLEYAFPKSYERVRVDYPELARQRTRIAECDQLAEYLASDRRIPFNEHGIFRYYSELDLS